MNKFFRRIVSVQIKNYYQSLFLQYVDVFVCVLKFFSFICCIFFWQSKYCLTNSSGRFFPENISVRSHKNARRLIFFCNISRRFILFCVSYPLLKKKPSRSENVVIFCWYEKFTVYFFATVRFVYFKLAYFEANPTSQVFSVGIVVSSR